MGKKLILTTMVEEGNGKHEEGRGLQGVAELSVSVIQFTGGRVQL